MKSRISAALSTPYSYFCFRIVTYKLRLRRIGQLKRRGNTDIVPAPIGAIVPSSVSYNDSAGMAVAFFCFHDGKYPNSAMVGT